MTHSCGSLCRQPLPRGADSLGAFNWRNWERVSMSIDQSQVLSYYETSPSLKVSANVLGLDLIDFPLSTPRRKQFIEDPASLGETLADLLEGARTREQFGLTLHEAARVVHEK